ncbi:MAG: glycosyltransferase family A protein [Patescibacteria group bacterium]
MSKKVKKPIVAVVTRTRDRPLFLKRAISSIAEQTFTDYVHVIVNDGGDRETLESIIGDLDAATRDRIRLFHRDSASQGPDTIFSESADRVDSEYIVMHDDDDTWHPEFLERTHAVLKTGAVGVAVRTDRVYEKATEDKIDIKSKIRYMPDVDSISLYRQCYENLLTPILFIYSREVYETVGKYDDTMTVAGDWEFGIRFLSRYDIEYLDPGFALANYHQRVNRRDNSYAQHSHRQQITRVTNKYLRRDLENGSLGLGYIINKLRYDHDDRVRLLKKLTPKSLYRKLRRR